MKVGFILAVALIPLLTASAPPETPTIATEVEHIDRYPSRPVSFANGVIGWPELVYARPEGYRALTLDLYLPSASQARPASGYPLVVYIHGGAWLAGDRRYNRPFVDFPAVLASLAARGYAVASVEYRLSGEAPFPAQIQDVKTAIIWLRARAATYHIDPERAMTWGVSAGGHLASLAAVSCGVAPFEPAPAAAAGATVPVPKVSDCVQGAVAWYGLFDFATLTEQARQGSILSREVPSAPEWRLLGCFSTGCTNGQISAASPVTYVDRRTPPMLLIVGDQDRVIPFQQTKAMAARLEAAGVPQRLIVIEGADHSLIGKTLDQTRAASLRALDETFRFVDEIFKKVPPPQP